jgi:hypothetical protein
MKDVVLQSTGSYNILDNEFSLSFSPNNNHLITFEGLSIEDMKEIQSLVNILIDHYDAEINDKMEENFKNSNENNFGGLF